MLHKHGATITVVLSVIVILTCSEERKPSTGQDKVSRMGFDYWDPEPWIREPQPPEPLPYPHPQNVRSSQAPLLSRSPQSLPPPVLPPAPLQPSQPPAPLGPPQPPAPLGPPQPPAPLGPPQPPAPLGPPQLPDLPGPPQPPAALGPPQTPAPLGPPQPPAPLGSQQSLAPVRNPSLHRRPSPIGPADRFPPLPIRHVGFPRDQHWNEYESMTRGGAHAEDIQCVRSNGLTVLSAVVTAPPEFVAMPVFEDAPNVNPTVSPDCAMRPNQMGLRSFEMYVNHFSKCGVRTQQGSDGKEWVSVTLRFPYMAGLRMADDEYVMIMCRPQERIATSSHVFDIRGSTSSQGMTLPGKKVFSKGSRGMACSMSLMTRPPGGHFFNQEMKSGSVVHVGQELRLRAAVREGDGWNYAVLRDVAIHRFKRTPSRFQTKEKPHVASFHEYIRGRQESDNNHIDSKDVYRDENRPKFGTRGRNIFPNGASDNEGFSDSAHLVLSNGCRNPAFLPVAPFHPHRDSNNPLVLTFDFKAFMFQDMRDGESLRLTGHVVACADQEDCQVLCLDDGPKGHRGKRKRRHQVHENGATINSTRRHIHGNVGNFTEDFELIVSLGSYTKTPITAETMTAYPPFPEEPAASNCKVLVIAISTSALLFCVVTTIAAAIALSKRRIGSVAPSGGERRRRKDMRH